MDDAGVPFHLAQEMAAIIPNARLVPVPGKANQPAGGDPRPILNALHAFLDEDPETRALAVPPTSASAPDSAFRAVLFTDLVGHTEMMSRLGDERGRDVLREHERITREVLKQHAGTEVKTMGDGFMASFASVTKAVECAVALQRAFDARNTTDPNPGVRFQPDRGGVGDTASVPGQSPVEPLNVRVGLNAGEPIEEEGPDGRSDLFGATVILASRIAARAEGGEILVSDNVRSLCSGKNFLFADRGDFTAKGFEDPVHIYEVSWRT
jgi:class 3 adenylate cyclase